MNQFEIRFRSRSLMMKVPVGVLLPECPMGQKPAAYYRPGKKYRVLWLLHGATCDWEDFLLHDQIEQHLRGHETMVVMPFGLNSDFADHMEFAGGYAFESYFFGELMPFIRNSFPASEKPEDNFIAGYSMGGAGALMLGLLHPERFAAIAPLGASERDAQFLRGLENLTGWQFREKALSNRKAFPTEYGNPAEGITLKEINMIARYATVGDYIASEECTGERIPEAIAKGNLPEMYFCCGENDDCAPRVVRLCEKAEALGAKNFGYDILPGIDHSGSEPVIARMLEHFGL